MYYQRPGDPDPVYLKCWVCGLGDLGAPGEIKQCPGCGGTQAEKLPLSAATDVEERER